MLYIIYFPLTYLLIFFYAFVVFLCVLTFIYLIILLSSQS